MTGFTDCNMELELIFGFSNTSPSYLIRKIQKQEQKKCTKISESKKLHFENKEIKNISCKLAREDQFEVLYEVYLINESGL